MGGQCQPSVGHKPVSAPSLPSFFSLFYPTSTDQTTGEHK